MINNNIKNNISILVAVVSVFCFTWRSYAFNPDPSSWATTYSEVAKESEPKILLKDVLYTMAPIMRCNFIISKDVDPEQELPVFVAYAFSEEFQHIGVQIFLHALRVKNLSLLEDTRIPDAYKVVKMTDTKSR